MADHIVTTAIIIPFTNNTNLVNEDIFNTGIATTEEVRHIIAPHLFPTLTLIFYFVVQIPVLTMGVLTNVLNIAIFTLSGQTDSVSIALTALSVSDLGYTLTYLTNRILNMLDKVFQVRAPIRLGYMGLAYYLGFLTYVFQDVSAVITIFVAVQKCCCVAIPHLFKNVFTSRRTFAVIVFLASSIALTHVPRLGGFMFSTITFPKLSNSTIISIVATPLYDKGRQFWLAFNKIVLPASCQVIGIACLITMAVQLRESVKFRFSSAGSQTDKINPADSKKPSYKMGEKERRAVTCLTLVLAIYVIGTIPLSMWSYAKLIVPAFFTDPRARSFVSMINNCQRIPVHVSASVNIFIYLKYNTKFRQTATILLDRCFYSRKSATHGDVNGGQSG